MAKPRKGMETSHSGFSSSLSIVFQMAKPRKGMIICQ